MLSNDLSWSQHIGQQHIKSWVSYIADSINSLLLRVFFKLCISLVRPNVEYANQVWSPYKLTPPIVSRNLHYICVQKIQGNAEYEQLQESFSLSDLQQHRLYLDLCSMFRIVHGMFHFPSAVFVRLDTCRFTRSSYHPSFVCPYARTCYYFNSSVPRTVRLWNTLPTPIVE